MSPNTKLVNIAMQWIRPKIRDVIQAIDDHESLLEEAECKTDIVPRISQKYIDNNPALTIPPLALIWLRGMSHNDLTSIAQEIIKQSIEEIASTGSEHSQIVRVAKEHPDWLYDQARRLANLIVYKLL